MTSTPVWSFCIREYLAVEQLVRVCSAVLYNPGGILLSGIQKIVLRHLKYFYLAVEHWCSVDVLFKSFGTRVKRR